MPKSNGPTLEPVALPPGAGQLLTSINVRHKLTRDQTGGSIYVFEGEFGPGEGNRLHVHQYEDEIGYVKEGALLVRLGDKELEVSAGGIAFLPRGIPHALKNPLDITLTYLFAAVPGGFLEHMFDEIEAAEKDGTLDDPTHRKISLKYGVEWLE